MSVKAKLEERIKRKENEINQLDIQIREARAYIQALQDSIKLLPKEDLHQESEETLLRAGSLAYKAMQFLKSTGAPMHITDILKGIGLPENRKNRITLGGSLSRYSRNKQVFRKTAPNTFSLIGTPEPSEPPGEFGIDQNPESEEVESENVPF